MNCIMVYEASYLMLLYFSNRNKQLKYNIKKRVRFNSNVSIVGSVDSNASTVKS